MPNMSTLYKGIAILLVLAGLFWYVFSLGADSRQGEVDEGVKALAECQAASKLQNAAVAELKTNGEAQDKKIILAQAKASKLLRESLVKAQIRQPVPHDCDAAIKWGQIEIEEITSRWNK